MIAFQRSVDSINASVPCTAQGIGLTNGDFNDDDGETQHKVIQEVLEEVNSAPPRECLLAWKSKAKSQKNAFKQEPR